MKRRMWGAAGLSVTAISCIAPSKAAPTVPAPKATPAPSGAAAGGAALADKAPMTISLIDGPTGWIKFCQDEAKGACNVSGGFAIDKGLVTTLGFSVSITPGPVHEVTLILPLSLDLRTPFVFTPDQAQAKGYVGTYVTCQPVGCSGTVNLPDDGYQALLKAKNIAVLVQNQVGRTVTFQAPLDGFADAVAGKAMTMAEVMQRRTEAFGKLKAEQAARQAQTAAPAATATPDASAAPAATAAPDASAAPAATVAPDVNAAPAATSPAATPPAEAAPAAAPIPPDSSKASTSSTP